MRFCTRYQALALWESICHTWAPWPCPPPALPWGQNTAPSSTCSRKSSCGWFSRWDTEDLCLWCWPRLSPFDWPWSREEWELFKLQWKQDHCSKQNLASKSIGPPCVSMYQFERLPSFRTNQRPRVAKIKEASLVYYGKARRAQGDSGLSRNLRLGAPGRKRRVQREFRGSRRGAAAGAQGLKPREGARPREWATAATSLQSTDTDYREWKMTDKTAESWVGSKEATLKKPFMGNMAVTLPT